MMLRSTSKVDFNFFPQKSMATILNKLTDVEGSTDWPTVSIQITDIKLKGINFRTFRKCLETENV